MGFDSILGFGVVRPAGPFDFDGIGDDIVARAASNPAKGQDSRIKGIDAAADDSLGRCQELGRSDDGVDAFMGHGGMAGLTIEDDADMIRSSHHRAGQDTDLAAGQGRPDVEAVNGIDAVEDAGRNQPLGAADRRLFFGWLADEDDRTGNIVFHLAQNLSGTEEDAHVAVMAAGVHLAGEIGRKGQARFFRHRQGVHIGPQGDDRSRLSAFERPQDSRRTGDMLLYINAERPQFGCHKGRRFHFFTGQFRIFMNVTAHGTNIRHSLFH